MRLDDLQHARTESLPRLRRRRGSTELRDAEGVPHVLLNRRGKAEEIALGGPDPVQRFLLGSRDTSHVILSQFWYNHASCMSVGPRRRPCRRFRSGSDQPRRLSRSSLESSVDRNALLRIGVAKRPQYLFSGLTKCGVCGAGFIMSSKNRLGCFGARDQRRCDNHLTIRLDEVEARVLTALQGTRAPRHESPSTSRGRRPSESAHRSGRCEARRVRSKTVGRPKADKLRRSAAKLGCIGSSRFCGGHAASHSGRLNLTCGRRPARAS